MDIFWIPEHHFSIWGRELLGNPLLMAADLAARTRKIRIGLGAAIITFWHPLRLAEDIALLDHLTGGRLELGVGRGNYGLEAANLNPLADPNKPAMNLKVFLETLGVLRAALDRGALQLQGRHLPVSGARLPRRQGAHRQRSALCRSRDRRAGQAHHLSAPEAEADAADVADGVGGARRDPRRRRARHGRGDVASDDRGAEAPAADLQGRRTTRPSAPTSRSATRPPSCATPSSPTARRRRGKHRRGGLPRRAQLRQLARPAHLSRSGRDALSPRWTRR